MRASVAAALAILALSGCGGSGGATTTTHHIDLTAFEKHGKAVFIAKCGICHQLADAGTSGTAGPKLTSPAQASLVPTVIEDGLGAMQPHIVSGRDAAAVAAYVAAATK